MPRGAASRDSGSGGGRGDNKLEEREKEGEGGRALLHFRGGASRKSLGTTVSRFPSGQATHVTPHHGEPLTGMD